MSFPSHILVYWRTTQQTFHPSTYLSTNSSTAVNIANPCCHCLIFVEEIKICCDVVRKDSRTPKGKTSGLDLSLFFQERASIQAPDKIKMTRNFTDVDKYMFSFMKNFS